MFVTALLLAPTATSGEELTRPKIPGEQRWQRTSRESRGTELPVADYIDLYNNNNNNNNNNTNNNNNNDNNNNNTKDNVGTLKNSTSLRRKLPSTATITVQILFDLFPEDIQWDITTEFGTLKLVSGGSYGDAYKNTIFTQTVALTLGTRYKFNIYDTYGDGIGFPGYYAIFFGTVIKNDFLLAFSDTFVRKFTDSVVFTAQLPSTPAPTPLQATISPQPTHAPTTCVNGGTGRSAKTSPFRRTPKITTASAIFNTTNAFCTMHSSYENCTNESREDCQWIFLPSSHTKGMCRIDPLSKCLQRGDCVCRTEDFHGGKSTYAGGIVFHAPISITARDITPYAQHLTYRETYSTPPDNANSKHPHDVNFFISKVDFTSRLFTYTFNSNSPLYNGLVSAPYTIAFKLHFLYMDIPLVGTILSGLGMTVGIDTSQTNHVITINGRSYVLTKPIKKWTCTSVVITPTTLYVAGNANARIIANEVIPSNTRKLVLGSFPGELFDVRIYSGTLSYTETREVGARCTNPNDPAALKVSRDIDLSYTVNGCDSRIPTYVTEPTTGGQTYGSGPFATMWVAPKEDPFSKGTFYDVPEGKLDEEYFFQHKKFQTYVFEKYYFEHDMIGFQLESYRHFSSPDEIPPSAVSVWNNPCRFMHQSNNIWDFPLYNTNYITKWEASTDGVSPNSVFDLRDIFFKRGFSGYQYVAHEMFHEFQGNMYRTYEAYGTKWMDESSASFGPASIFGPTNVIYAAMPLAYPYPVGYENPSTLAVANAHFLSSDLSTNDSVRAGHMYNCWLLWWMLGEHAGMPFLQGKIYSNEKSIGGLSNGILTMIRIFVEAEGMDLGDVWGVFVAHFRTWDFKLGDEWAAAEQIDFNNANKDPLPSSTTLESRKTSVIVDSISGTSGLWLSGPSALRPGPFGWNCLTMNGVAPNRFITIDVKWGSGMGFQSNTNPPTLPNQQIGCDDDPRFYNNMVVVHNPSTGERRYWKLKGKTPNSLVINSGSIGTVNIYILMVPTPATDYAGGFHVKTSTFMYPIPVYNYQYKVSVNTARPSGSVEIPESPKKNGIVQFAPTKGGFWQPRCTCIDDPTDTTYQNACLDPIFSAKPTTASTPSPTVFSPSGYPSASHEPSSTAPVLTVKPTLTPTFTPTSSPTAKPTTLAPTTKPTAKPTAKPTTAKPATAKPTAKPTTAKPATAKPTTKKPTTSKPTTPNPIQSKPNRLRNWW